MRAQDQPLAFTIDLPFQADAATPAWLGHPVLPARAFAALDLPITPPDATSSLLVTVFFTETVGGFLRLSWENDGGAAQTLSPNFYEGTGLGNQRSLLISPETLQGEGTLDLQASGATLGIERVRLEWLRNKNQLVSAAVSDVLVTPATGPTISALTLTGDPAPAADSAWQGQLVTVPIVATAQRIEDGVEFSVQLDAVPTAGRLMLKEEGLPWGRRLVVWINAQRAGTITPGVPDLADGGFFSDPALASTYVGWRDGSIFLPVKLLQAGLNTLQFSTEDDAALSDGGAVAPAMGPLAVKEVTLQLAYPQVSGDTSAAVPTTATSETNAVSAPTAPASTP